MPANAKESPAAGAHAPAFTLFLQTHAGNTSNDLWESTFDGTTWTLNHRIQGLQSKATVALASDGRDFHLVRLDASSNQLSHSKLPTTSGASSPIPSQRSKVAPALIFDGTRVRLVRVDESSNELLTSFFDGRGWTISERVGDARSKATPALASYAGSIQVVHLDPTSNEIWHRRLE